MIGSNEKRPRSCPRCGDLRLNSVFDHETKFVQYGCIGCMGVFDQDWHLVTKDGPHQPKAQAPNLVELVVADIESRITKIEQIYNPHSKKSGVVSRQVYALIDYLIDQGVIGESKKSTSLDEMVSTVAYNEIVELLNSSNRSLMLSQKRVAYFKAKNSVADDIVRKLVEARRDTICSEFSDLHNEAVQYCSRYPETTCTVDTL